MALIRFQSLVANKMNLPSSINTSSFVLGLLTCSVASSVSAQEVVSGITVNDCLVEAIDDNRVSAGADGMLTELSIEEGQIVRADEVIGMIDPDQARLNLTLKQAEEEQARLTAENDVNIRAAEKSMEYELAEAKSAEELYKKQAMPYWDMRREVLEAERSKLAIELARNEQKVAVATYAAKTAEMELAKHEIVKRQIKCSFDGIVATRYGKKGEWVQAGTPVARIVRLDTVKVEGDANALTNPEHIFIGAPVKIKVRISSDRSIEFSTTLKYVSPILESDDTYRVWAQIENPKEGNRYLISPGMSADMTIIPAKQTTFN